MSGRSTTERRPINRTVKMNIFGYIMQFTIKKIITALKNEFSCIDIAYLFGSSVKGKVKEGSDIDIAVLIKSDILISNPLIGLEIEVFLQERFGYPAEVVILNKANSILKYQVLRTGRRLFERNPEKRSISELCFIKDYFDTLYYQQKRNNYGQ